MRYYFLEYIVQYLINAAIVCLFYLQTKITYLLKYFDYIYAKLYTVN